MARVHARSVRVAGGSVAGVATTSPEGAERAARLLDAPRWFVDARALIESPDIDVVHICTPNASHAELVRLAAEAGKHIICEKPLATSITDAEELVDLVRVAGVVATIPFVYRFHPLVREVRRRLSGDARIFSITGGYLQDWMVQQSDLDWRLDSAAGGASRALADIGSHLIDLLEFVTGDQLRWAQARTRIVFDQRGGQKVDTEDLGMVMFELASGALGNLTVSQVAHGHKNHLWFDISAESESLRFDQESPDVLWVGRRDQSLLLPRDPATLSGDAARLASVAPAGHPLGYLDAFAAFVGDTYAAIDGEWREGLPGFSDGLRSVRVIESLRRSAETGRPVERLPEGDPILA